MVTARKTDKLSEFEKEFPQTALILPLDVTRLSDIEHTVEAARQRFGGIDILINNAGYGYRAYVEEGIQKMSELCMKRIFLDPSH